MQSCMTQEDVGLMLWKWLPPGGDFQHLASWRELVVATACCRLRCLHMVRQRSLLMKRQCSVSLNPEAGCC
jgi:hypothetical protein